MAATLAVPCPAADPSAPSQFETPDAAPLGSKALATPAEDLLPDVLARLGEWPITRAMVWPAVSARIRRILAAGEPLPSARLRFLLRPVVNDIIDEKLLGPKAAAAGFVPDLERARAHFEALSQDAVGRARLDRLLQDANLTAEQYTAKLALRTAITDWVRHAFVDPQEVSPQEVASFYETHRQGLVVPASVWLERIVVAAGRDQETRGKARVAAAALRVRIAAGVPFAAAALPAATSPAVPPEGFSQARVLEANLPAPVLNVVKSLEAGEISPVVELPDAFVLVRWQDRYAERQLTFGEVAAGLELKLKEDKGRERFAKYLDDLKRDAGLVFYPPLDQRTALDGLPPPREGVPLLP